MLLAVVAALAGGVVLAVLRRPAPPIRVIEPPPSAVVVVQVDGEVFHPGVHTLASGSRVGDAINAAGGVTPEADVSLINFARVVRDGERVSVPSRLLRDQLVRVPGTPSGSVRRVNINSANTDELLTLPGIGPALAHRIADFRIRHGPFHRLEDLLQVEGIGPKLLERLRGLVTTD